MIEDPVIDEVHQLFECESKLRLFNPKSKLNDENQDHTSTKKNEKDWLSDIKLKTKLLVSTEEFIKPLDDVWEDYI